MKVFDKARELACEIKCTKEYNTLIETKNKLDADEEATALIRDMRLLQQEYIKTLRENLDKDAINSMEKLLKSKHEEILDNSITREYIKAKDVFDKMLKQVNKLISDEVKLKTAKDESNCDNCNGCN